MFTSCSFPVFQGSTGASSKGYHPSGLKQEVKVALRALRDKLWAEQKEKEVGDRMKEKCLQRWETRTIRE